MNAPAFTPALSDAQRIAQLEQQLQSTASELQRALLKVQVLEHRLRLQRIQKYGPASEELTDAQLALLDKVAAILSVVETCRRLNIPTRDCLGTVLPGLARTSIQRLAELTPTAWAARNR